MLNGFQYQKRHLLVCVVKLTLLSTKCNIYERLGIAWLSLTDILTKAELTDSLNFMSTAGLFLESIITSPM